MAEITAMTLKLAEGLLGHFFDGCQRFELLSDGEWAYYSTLHLNEKGKDLVAAGADIMLFIAIQTDKLLQAITS